MISHMKQCGAKDMFGFIGGIFGNSDATSVSAHCRSALDAVNANVMIADQNNIITYVNRSAEELMKRTEVELRRLIPNFNASSLLGNLRSMFESSRRLAIYT